MSDDTAYHCYVPQTIPCPNCSACSEHEGREPKVTVRTRYYRVLKDGTRVEMTKEQYDRRLIN